MTRSSSLRLISIMWLILAVVSVLAEQGAAPFFYMGITISNIFTAASILADD